jgi:flavin-dependent dehydrogenase
VKLDYPAVVLGAGPAGARVAELLARRGVGVLVLEQGDGVREKPCGGLLNRRGQAALGAMLPDAVRREPCAPPLEYRDLDHRLRLRYDPGYLNMHRGRFDAWLRQRALDAGARLRFGQRVTGLALLPGGVELATADGLLRCACVIDATGWRALSRKLLAAPEARRPRLLAAVQGRIRASLPEDAMWAMYRSRTTPFYGWLIPQGGGEFLLGYAAPVGAPTMRNAAGLAPSRAWDLLRPYLDYIESRGETCELLDAKPRGCPITWIRDPSELWWGMGGVHAIGEAAGLVSPSSGGGIHCALEHAAALAQALLDAGLGSASPHGARATVDQHMARARTQALLAPQLSHLRFSCIKAWVAARSGWRGIATRCLPVTIGARVIRLPWV